MACSPLRVTDSITGKCAQNVAADNFFDINSIIKSCLVEIKTESVNYKRNKCAYQIISKPYYELYNVYR